MRAARLLRMGVPELAFRARQEAFKWLERVPRPGLAPRYAPGRGEERAAFAAPERFFAGAVEAGLPDRLEERVPGTRARTLAAAGRILRGRFDLLGYRGLTFGKPIDWHLDPTSGRRAPRVRWSAIEPLDPDVVGDVKVIWELSRHQWLVTLGQAYRWSGDERLARAFAACVLAWLRANPPGIGVNWASSLEVALRLISWCWALLLFRESKALTPRVLARIIGSVQAQATHVQRYLSRYSSPNTHLTGEALGLFYAGCLFPDLPGAGRWRSLGRMILLQEIGRQVLPDGVHFERSTCYQRYTLDIYLHFLILAERNRVPVPARARERVERMLDFLLALRRAGGRVPLIGDADGGRLLPLGRRAAGDFRDAFSTAAALFGRPECAWAAGGPAPETAWLLGREGIERFEALPAAPPQAAPSRLFGHGGYAVLRSGWEERSEILVFDCGPLGCPLSAAHGHADLLGIECSVAGEPFLVDPGMPGYAAHPEWRDHFRGTAAHSTVRIDGEEQALPAGPFAWRTRPRAILRQWLSGGDLVVADAEHDAYARLKDPVIHRRRVIFRRPGCWVIVDDLRGAAEHRVELRFQFGALRVWAGSDGWVRARHPTGAGLLLGARASAPLRLDIREGDLRPIQGWISPDYGRLRRAPVALFSAAARLPVRIVSVLLPLRGAQEPPPRVSWLDGGGPGPRGIVLGDGEETLLLGDDEVRLQRG